ncbi:hypothetical protein ALC62_04091 [Cyphomyrmex costatus]|uniref:Uncharacterized protein n=1 Tax=Cyphomyrmex costatus TaxID=456900 RepID=A0A151IKL9_9HYME|nr:hypothetical protein ALC62_04091 [Cyphomyrmex costatus]
MSHRGPYKQYLRNLNIPIPDTTLRRRQHEVNQHNEHALSNNDNINEVMDWNSTTATYFDSRENSECSSNSDEEFITFEQSEERLHFTMQKRDHYSNEDNNEGNIQSNECASLYNNEDSNEGNIQSNECASLYNNSDYSVVDFIEGSSTSDDDGSVLSDGLLDVPQFCPNGAVTGWLRSSLPELSIGSAAREAQQTSRQSSRSTHANYNMEHTTADGATPRCSTGTEHPTRRTAQIPPLTVQDRGTENQTQPEIPPPLDVSYSPVSSPLSLLNDLLDLLPSPPPFLADSFQEDPPLPSYPSSDEEPLDLTVPRSSSILPESPPCLIRNPNDIQGYLVAVTQTCPDCRVVVYIPGINHPFSTPIATLLAIRPSSLGPPPPTLHNL